MKVSGSFHVTMAKAIVNTVKFNIKQLGAVRDSSIELKRLMLFSGESGLGKSYVAFLVHYLYFILIDTNRFANFFTDSNYDFEQIFSEKKAGEVLLKIPVADVLSWINKDAIAYIGYTIGNNDFKGEVEIVFPFEDEYFEFTFSEEMKGLDNREEVFYKFELKDLVYSGLSNAFKPSPTLFAALIQGVLLDSIFNDLRFIERTFLMPPSRGALMELAERPAFQSGMYEEFFDYKAELNRPLRTPVAIDPLITQCLWDINDGKVQQVNGRYMYETQTGVAIPLTAAASSIKELAPITLFFSKFSPRGSSLLIEEPEAHLHPGRQIKVADLIGRAINMGCQMQITTHSDYFIKRLNNLMKLHQLRDKLDPTVFAGIMEKYQIKEECLIDPQDIGAFVLKRNQDGSSGIETQDVVGEDEIAFESFYQVIKKDLELSSELRKHTI